MLSLTRIAPLLLACNLLVSAAHSPFYGKWELDKKKTQAQGCPDDLKVEIKENGSSGILVKSQYTEPKSAVYPLMWVGIMTYELPLSTDGSEKLTQIGPYAHVSKTTLTGNKMTTNWKAALENKGSVEGQWIRTLSPDGKEMTLQVISKASDGRSMDQTLVFKRK